MEELAIKLSDIIKMIPDIGILLAALKIFITCRHDSKIFKEIVSGNEEQLSALSSALSLYEQEQLVRITKILETFTKNTTAKIAALENQVKALSHEVSLLRADVMEPELPKPAPEPEQEESIHEEDSVE